MARGNENIPMPLPKKLRGPAKAVAEEEEEEILFFSPETLKLKVDIPKNYVEDDRDFYEAKATARLVHQGIDRKDPLRLKVSPDRQQSLEHCTFDHDLREHEEMKTNSSVSFEVFVRVWKTDLVTINAQIAGTPPGGAVPAHKFLPGQSLTKTAKMKLMATATGRDPFVTLDALLDIEIDITAKKRPTATTAAHRRPPRRPYITSDDDGDGPQFQFKQPPCKKCKKRPVDGDDGLCSVCRNAEDKGDKDPPSTLVEVPDVISKTRFQAGILAQSHGLAIADSRSAKKENREKRSSDQIHPGETVSQQKPAPGTRVQPGSVVTLDYQFTGEIEYDRGEEYPGEIIHRDDRGKMHREDAPAWIKPTGFLEGVVYGEVWQWHGSKYREDGPADITYYQDGGRKEIYYEDDIIHREDGPAVVITDHKGEVIYEEHWRRRDYRLDDQGNLVYVTSAERGGEDSALHNETGAAVRKQNSDGQIEERYFLEGQELSREEWLERLA